jgi:hypothetical protein
MCSLGLFCMRATHSSGGAGGGDASGAALHLRALENAALCLAVDAAADGA